MVDGAGGFDELFGPGYRLVIFDPNAEEPRVGGDGGGIVEVAWSAAHRVDYSNPGGGPPSSALTRP